MAALFRAVIHFDLEIPRTPPPLPKEFVEYLQQIDDPVNDIRCSICILHKSASVNDSEVKVFFHFDHVITPQQSSEAGREIWVAECADPQKKPPHACEEQWIAGRFVSRDVNQPLADETLLPLQVAEFSYGVERYRLIVVGEMVQHLFTAARGAAFDVVQLPGYIQDLTRNDVPNATGSFNDGVAESLPHESLNFGGITAKWAVSNIDQELKLTDLMFRGDSLNRPFGLTLDVLDETYQAIFPGGIEQFAVEMGAALEVFLSAEAHIKGRQWSSAERDRLGVLSKRYEEKMDSSCVETNQICKGQALAPATDSLELFAEDTATSPPPISSGPGRNTKANRRKKEKGREKKKMKQATISEAEALSSKNTPPQIGQIEPEEDVEMAQNISSSPEASAAVAKPKALISEPTPEPDERQKVLLTPEASTETDNLKFLISESTPEPTEPHRIMLMPETSTETDKSKTLTPVAKLEPTESHDVKSHHNQKSNTNSPSAQSSLVQQTSKTAAAKPTRSLMQPALPLNLHSHKKRSAKMEENKSPMQAEATKPEMVDSEPREETEESRVSKGLLEAPSRAETEPSTADPPATEQPATDLPATDPPTTEQPATEQPASETKPTPERLISFDTYEWRCVKQDCRKTTSPYDGSTVICPRCGPYSRVRYCSKQCLFDDVLFHWGLDCGKQTLDRKANPMTIEARQINIQPFIPSLDRFDKPEHHRQMVRHSLDTTGDYFIFSDWLQWRADGFIGNWPAHKQCSGDLLNTVSFTPTGSPSVPARGLFVRLIRVCFLIGGQRPDMVRALYKMIRGRLDEQGQFTGNIAMCLIWQISEEFGFPGLPSEMLGDAGPENWPVVAGQVVQLERQYRAFLAGRAGLGREWTNAV